MRKSEPKKVKNEYIECLRTELNIKYLSQKYRKAHEWIPRLAAEAPELAPEEALKKIRERLTKLRGRRKRLKESCLSERKERARQEPDLRRSLPVRPIPPRERSFVHSAGSPGSIELAYPRPVEHYLYERTVRAATGWIDWESIREHREQGRRIDGIARASAFKDYVWDYTRIARARSSYYFMPLGSASVDPDDFNGATGLQFGGEIYVPFGALGFPDPYENFGFAGILQYELPEVPWDGAVQWKVDQEFEISSVAASGDWGVFKLGSCGRQSPDGEDFPAEDSCFEAFGIEEYPVTISCDGEDFEAGPFNATDTFQSAFRVEMGQKPRIYIGLACQLGATDGEVWLGNLNLAYHYSTAGYGLSFTYFRL